MKHLYISLLCTLLCGSAAVAGPRFAAKKAAKKIHIVKKTPDTSIWRPAGQTDYMYMDGEWITLGDVTYTYDGRGNVLETLTQSDYGYDKTVCTYNDDNNVVSSIESYSDDGTVWEESQKTTYKYDSVLPDYVIERMGYDMEEGEWVANYRCETNAITRNADGNITEIVKSLPLGSELSPAYRLNWGYDAASGKANTMDYYLNYSDNDVADWVLSQNTDYRNIVWDRTDGQMTESDMAAYFEGKNRISSAEAYYDGELDGYIFVTYDDKGGYLVKETYSDPNIIGATTEKRYTDDYGSYVITMAQYFDDEGNYVSTPTYLVYFTVTYDSHGNILAEEYSEEMEGEKELLDSYIYAYTYDSNGNVEECVSSYFDFDLMDYVPESKIVYHKYDDITTGVKEISSDSNHPAEYFDLSGRKVSNPVKGIYIKRQGNTTTKVIVK